MLKLPMFLRCCVLLLACHHAGPRAADPPPPPDQIRSASSQASLELSDFKGKVPLENDRPKDVNNKPVKAFTTLQIGPYDAGDGTKGTDGSGNTTYTPKAIKVNLAINQSKTWTSDPGNPDLLEHERGHLEEAKISQNLTQAELNKLVAEKKIVGTGATKEAAQMDAMVKANILIQKVSQAAQDAYDVETESGTDLKKQGDAKARQTQALKAPNTDPNAKTGPEAKSVSPKTLTFNASTGRLHIENDMVVATAPTRPGYHPDPLDAIIGADVIFPDFELRGRNSDGFFFFSSLGAAPMLTLEKAGITYLGTTLESLIYNPTVGMFYGLGGEVDAAAGLSHFVDALLAEIRSGPAALIGIELLPDIDFMRHSAGFTADAASGFQNFEGLRQLNVPEPGTLVLLLAALAGAGWSRRRQSWPAARRSATSQAAAARSAPKGLGRLAQAGPVGGFTPGFTSGGPERR